MLADANDAYDTRNKSCFRVGKYRTTIRELSIVTRGPKVWDSLPDEIKDISNIGLFKSSVATYYVNFY